MKKLLALLVALMMLLGAAAAEEAAAPALQKDLVILFTSDVHCGVSQNWGYAGLAAAKEYYAKDNYVLLVDDGDAIQGEPIGTMSHGESILNIMNAVGYDLAIPGNHEFDYGVETFLELAQKANYQYLSCNFNRKGEMIFEPWAIREFDGVKIGFVGVTTPYTLRTSTPKYFMDEEGNYIYGFLQEDTTGETLYQAVQKAVDDVRAAGASYVFVIAHLGNETEVIPFTYSDVISHITGIDALLDGHSHDYDVVTMKDKEGKDVIRCAVGTKLDTIGKLTVSKAGGISVEQLSWNQKVSAPDLLNVQNAAGDVVKAEVSKLDETLQNVVAKTAVKLVINDPDQKTEEGKPIRIVRRTETNLGDLCADAYLNQAGEADIAFVNGGGIRAEIQEGDVTLNDILKVHPYGNSLTVIEVTGQQVLDALEWSVHSLPGEFGGFNQVAGLTFEVDAAIESPCVSDDNGMFLSVEEGKTRRVRNVLVGGEALDPAKVYKLASHDYQLLDHGDGYTMFDGSKVLQESVKLDNQVLIDYITETLGGVVGEGYDNPYGQGRIVSVGAGE
ncbi:MAG: bifunctional metallophosphatase/5'-nucleotidase [Clostridia bacterium]|nr:bifunctional metallophosphatase/5'-nucleotidase [Clostridia bacterium]